MSIFKEQKQEPKSSSRTQLTNSQISDSKPKFRAMINCIREHGILDSEIIEAIRENISKRVLEDSKLFKF